MIIGLIASWVGLIIGFIVAIPFSTFVFGSPFFASLGVANLFFIIALPIIGFIQFAARYVFKRKTSTRTRNGMTLFWVFNVISAFSVASFVVRDFNQEAEIAQSIQEYSFTADTVQLSLAKEVGRNSLMNIDGVKIMDDNLIVNNIEIDFGKSVDDKFRLVQTHFSRGKNSKEIESLTKAISYEAIKKGNEIIFPADFSIQKGSKWRGQKVKIRLEVPEGKTVKFGTKRHNKLEDFISHHSRWEGKIPSVRWHGIHRWTMKENGFYSKADAIQEKKTEGRMENFKKVIIKGEVKVKIEKGEVFDVKITGRERELRSVKMEQVGDILEINSPKNRRDSPVRVLVVAPDLERIDLEYTDDVVISGFDGKKLDVFNEGRREVKVFVNVDSLYLNFKGNKSDIRGKGKFLKVKLDQRARMDGEHYVVNNALVNAKNAGKIRLEVLDTLRTDLTQGSRMAYEDAPKEIIDERKERQRKAQEEKTRKEKERELERAKKQ